MGKDYMMKYGVKLADVCVSLNEALNAAGGASQTVDGMLSMPMADLFDTMARNNIRFIYIDPKVNETV